MTYCCRAYSFCRYMVTLCPYFSACCNSPQSSIHKYALYKIEHLQAPRPIDGHEEHGMHIHVKKSLLRLYPFYGGMVCAY